MASFGFDQAEGLRRMIAGPKTRIVTVLSAAPAEDKKRMLINLAAAASRAGSDTLLFDAQSGARGVSSLLGLTQGATLLDAVRGERRIEQVIHAGAFEFEYAALTRGSLPQQDAHLNGAFEALCSRADLLLVDAEPGEDGALPIDAMASGDIVVQVAGGADSIKTAYALIKRISAQLGRRPFQLVVTGAGEREAQLVHANIARTASRYLGVELVALGSIPSDDHLQRAARLGRSVVEAFPLSPAASACRSLAGKLLPAALPDHQLSRAASTGHALAEA